MEFVVSIQVLYTDTRKGERGKYCVFVFAGATTTACAGQTPDPLTLTARANNEICCESRVLDGNPEHRQRRNGHKIQRR